MHSRSVTLLPAANSGEPASAGQALPRLVGLKMLYLGRDRRCDLTFLHANMEVTELLVEMSGQSLAIIHCQTQQVLMQSRRPLVR